ncbi:Gfo/Idh/MocA family protein [Paenibacillus hexagrammi]|uniref:Gfo/Idh/MocA family oxidoreductase n=1 Tax=Paenibacillus hexagrammi TaxID=2908839 RepID=A0ABY3SH42_9BACL|nr:Gfo/Idh/MocA family oxidoreductase [Paenibacillus sp. YPD9-1]UJF32514.1 Gfo/Idh/MocA family oxidoreductase [Paenibacillus sp. YPD9-1]
MIRIGKISYWHVHAWDYTREAQEHPDVDIVAVWDEDEKRGREAAGKLGVDFHTSLDELLGRSDVDAVIVDAPTSMHRDIMVAAARAGKHIFTEKVLAPTQQEANEIVREAAQSGVKLTVSLPRLNDGYTLAIRQLLSEGALGRVTQVRVRLSHNGATAGWLPEHFYNPEECISGALIDLGCHPMYLTHLFLDEATSGVSAQYGYITGKAVEDNAAALLFTDSGALGIVEAGFVTSSSPFTIEIHGTEGSLLYGTPEEKLLLRCSNGGFDSWEEVPLTPRKESAFNQWIGHIRNNTEAEENIRLALALSSLMEASNQSVRERRTVRIDELRQ